MWPSRARRNCWSSSARASYSASAPAKGSPSAPMACAPVSGTATQLPLPSTAAWPKSFSAPAASGAPPMFPTTSSVDLRLSEAAAQLEAADPALRVIAGRIFRLPYARVRARAALQNPRRFNILEEFVLRAAAELAPPPAPAELASLLGLDQLFVDATLHQLQLLKALGRNAEGAVTLTAAGKKFLKDGQ